MDAGYTEIPSNFDAIEPYVITEKEDVLKELIMSVKCYFYDACGFRKHIHMKHPEYFFEFIKKSQGIIVITRCILMELASLNGVLKEEYVEYLRKLCQAKIKVLLLWEEDIFDVLNICFSSAAQINGYLSWAVKTVKVPTSTIEKTFRFDERLKSERDLFGRFFREVRHDKEPQDNLGEEMIGICVHLLSNLPESSHVKYVVLTEDKGAIGLLNKIIQNIWRHHQMLSCSAMTTAKLAQRLYEEKIITGSAQVEEMISTGSSGGLITIFGSEEYDLEPKEKSMTCRQLAQKIVTSNPIHINY